MMHSPISIQELSFFLPHKQGFEDFTTQITYGSRIGIIGRNGSGKSILLKMLFNSAAGTLQPEISIPKEVILGYVPQGIEDFQTLSGGQRFNTLLTKALSLSPNVLLLDEPTNHLDSHNRKSLMRLLQRYVGTLIVVSHDTELLRNCVDTFWHIDNGKIKIFSGNYDDYLREIAITRVSTEKNLLELHKKKKTIHNNLMKEQTRAAKSRLKGGKSIAERKWPTVVSASKARRGETTSGRKYSAIDHKRIELIDRLSEIRLPEIITPKFAIAPVQVQNKTLLSIREGSIGYESNNTIVNNIHFMVHSTDRILIEGDNGSGKSTLIKAILDDKKVIRTGDWSLPKQETIGYLDQHYTTLDPKKTVFETLKGCMPHASDIEIRRYLNDFLFRKNEEAYAKVSTLSEGEKARLCLAQIAAKTPSLLILDEMTNNLDLETRQHVIEVLNAYPGALIIISHDADFVTAIGIKTRYAIPPVLAQT